MIRHIKYILAYWLYDCDCCPLYGDVSVVVTSLLFVADIVVARDFVFGSGCHPLVAILKWQL